MSERGASLHKTVLLNETIRGLNLSGTGRGQRVLDATFGGGGHSRGILDEFPEAEIVALDRDGSVWKKGEWKKYGGRIAFHEENFRNLDKIPEKEKFDGIIFDLGISSDQLENSGRGFTFKKDEPLLMTMKENPTPADLTAKEIVNEWSQENLEKIIRGYGEERFAGRIARGIAEGRKRKEIRTTAELAEIISRAVPAGYRHGKIHFATRTFQALRIAVNDELGALSEGMAKGFAALKPAMDGKAGLPAGKAGGRMAVISFHSLEDRMVKRFYKAEAEDGKARLTAKKPITPAEAEMKENPRSRSAKLRILEKII